MIRQVTGNTLSLHRPDGGVAVQMVENVDGENCRVQLVGAVNNDSAWDVYDELCALASVGKNVILDMSDVSYLSRTLVDRLISLQRKLENMPSEGLPIVNMPRQLYDELSKDGLTSALDIEIKEE